MKVGNPLMKRIIMVTNNNLKNISFHSQINMIHKHSYIIIQLKQERFTVLPPFEQCF